MIGFPNARQEPDVLAKVAGMDFLVDYYLAIKALHIIAVIAWMAGMLYLPRLFVYHADAPVGSELSETFKVMEEKLLRVIMLPAMLASWVFGLILSFLSNVAAWSGGWFHTKLLLLLVLTGIHGFFAKLRKDFAADRNQRPARFFRIINEVPTVLMIGIVFLVILKPF